MWPVPPSAPRRLRSGAWPARLVRGRFRCRGPSVGSVVAHSVHRWGWAALLTVHIATVAAAPVHGHFKLGERWDTSPSDSLAAAVGGRQRADTSFDLRLINEPRRGPWSAVVHAEVLWDHGDAVALDRRVGAIPALAVPTPADTAWLHLEHTLTDRNDDRAVARFDRFYAGYTGSRLVLRAGRQALTWGTGLIFHPADLFDPFAPNATDTEYKSGTDMLYGQWLFADGSDTQVLAVPRRDPHTGKLERRQSSVAVRYHRAGPTLESAWMLAQDYQDTVIAVSLAGAWGGASWSTSLVPTFLDGDGTRTSAVVDLSDAVTWAGRPVTLVLEYYRNGFGHGGRDYAPSDLSAALSARLARGQLFNTGRDYLAGGLSIEWTPLLKLDVTAIVNLQDRSELLLAKATYSLAENSDIVTGMQIPVGAHGSEFGGLPVAAGGAPYVAPPTELYIRLARYF